MPAQMSVVHEPLMAGDRVTRHCIFPVTFLILFVICNDGSSLSAAPVAKASPTNNAAIVRDNLRRAKELFDQKKYQQAEAETRLAITLLERKLGPDSLRVQDARSFLAFTLMFQDKHSEAEAEFRKVNQVRERVLGPAHRDTLRGRSELSMALLRQRKYSEAEAEYRAILKFQEKTPGPLDPQTLVTRADVARALAYQGKVAYAEAHFRLVLGDMESVLGSEHPETLRARYGLVYCLGRRNKLQEAREVAARGVELSRKLHGQADQRTQKWESLHEDLTRNQLRPLAGPEAERAL